MRAIATITPAWVTSGTHAFVPVSTQSSPSGTAWQRSAAASLPASGSERANAPSSSPRAIGRSHRSFCASVPQRNSICVGSELCTLIMTAADASAAAISSSASR